ncbi:cell division protein ZipA C-terminal FtsZ-binding domain-containing protein [Acinetobacter sp. ANC 3832]|uniref:cell division protein ZipA C-terminal FtsZ-binding domain-containing protein n=1 Tax=Acinetobacter sp. ANC 3832 TaxID=1977874 RepID=UPI000A33AF64|nr:cell division protein ZipA C-terminal FtsZ-binding domain-containing protein [Acinetobacter sp. ANC 3832]OTG94115.1 cell division protein ZipA [Acinetobacter sp. ANC 3832]
MEVTTIIGIVVAVLIILVGLRMVMRKSDDAAPSLESELHINSDSQLPVIPRHVRNQLGSESEEKSMTQRIEPELNTVNAVDLVDDKKELAIEPSSTSATLTSTEPSSVDAETKASNAPKASVEVQTETEENKATDLLVATETSTVVVENQKPKADSVEHDQLNLNPNVEAVAIQDFDEESGILDAHLHEQRRSDDDSDLANAESYIVLNVYPNPRKALSGDKTLKVLLKYGLRFGEMNCFHRYENPEEESQLMFSVLRITEEGPVGFDLESLSGEQVQGLAFFLALPHPDVQKGFDTMVSIAGLVARETDGTVYDENNLEFTPQLKEHWRHKAIDYRSGQEV